MTSVLLSLLMISSRALASNRVDSLIGKSKLITKVDGWEEIQTTVGGYEWWSPHEILEFRTGSDFLLDVNKKTTKQMPDSTISHFRRELSPDRAMSVNQTWSGRTITWTVTDPFGRRRIGSWTAESRTDFPKMGQDFGYMPPEAIWSPDSKSLNQIEYWPNDKQLMVQVIERTLPSLQVVHAYPTKLIDWFRGRPFIYDDKILLQRDGVYGMTFLGWNLNDTKAKPQEWILNPPKDLHVEQYYPSPDFSHAVFVIRGFTAANKNHSVSLWKGGLHGEGLTEIGEIIYKSGDFKKDMGPYQYFGGVAWNPDSKHVSFIYDRNLYMVAAFP